MSVQQNGLSETAASLEFTEVEQAMSPAAVADGGTVIDNGSSPFFVTLEGIDGAGKSSVAEALQELRSDAVLTQEPSDQWTGKQVRKALTDESTTPLTDYYLFLADRAAHIQNTIRPALQQGKMVISDRFADSTRAYQGLNLQGVVDYPMMFIEETMDPISLEPDLTLLLDVSVETGMERLDGEEKYEKESFLRKVREGYKALAATDTERIVRIDAEQSLEEVIADAKGAVRAHPAYE